MRKKPANKKHARPCSRPKSPALKKAASSPKRIARKIRSVRKKPSAARKKAPAVFLPSALSHQAPPVAPAAFSAPPFVPDIPKESFELPTHYGDNRIVLLVRDPWWIYAYWEITPDREREVLDLMRREEAEKDRLVLRVYDVSGASPAAPRSFFDIEITFLVSNWYIDVGIPDREWIVEIGLRAKNGRFFALARSNSVRTPRFGISDVLDEEWMLPDDLYWKLFGLSGALVDPKSSLSVREILEKYLRSIVSSEGISSLQGMKIIRNEPLRETSAKILERP